MATPAEIVNLRYGQVFLSKARNLKIISQENRSSEPVLFTEFNALLHTGTLNPTVLTALVRGSSNVPGGLLQELDWDQVHVRTYSSWDDVISAGIVLKDTEPQRPTSMASQQIKDIPMRSVNETINSKIYHFDQPELGRMTVFTTKPFIATGGNDLPRRATLLPWLADANFVFERA